MAVILSTDSVFIKLKNSEKHFIHYNEFEDYYFVGKGIKGAALFKTSKAKQFIRAQKKEHGIINLEYAKALPLIEKDYKDQKRKEYEKNNM